MLKYLLSVLIAAFAAHGAAIAQEWPAQQPIHVIISNTPGSALDVTARIVMEQVGRQIGQTVVAENRPGAANTIGIAAVAKAAPDGYTILVTTSGIAISPFTHKTLPYDTIRDLRAVMPLGNLTNVLITPAGRFKSLQDLVAKAKVKPNALLYASIGPGSTGNLTAERLGLSAGFKATQVPFKGTAEGVADLATGRVDFFFTPITAALGLIREHKVEALAIGSSSRSSLMPDLPTTVEAGYPDSDYNF
jgi:tripartite-type tricarboxylate transporter receptor subunit TctC